MRASFISATFLVDGTILIADGYFEPTAEIYDVGLRFSNDWRPVIAQAHGPTPGNRHLGLTGSGFQGVSQASGGNTQDSATNYPIVQLRSLENSRVVFLLVDPLRGWSDTSFVSSPVRDFPSGPSLVTVFANGIRSDAKYLLIGQSDR